MEGIIFKNSKRYINEGSGLGKGLLYCGNKYTNDGGCLCGKCDGHCGPDDGCPCPDCENTLSYILYSSGKMKCGFCKSNTLIRINIYNLKFIVKENSFKCNICKNTFYSNKHFIPLMRCFKCNYNMCPKCAFSKIIPFKPKIPKLELGLKDSIGIIYCRNKYTDSGFCLCKGCDGNCGPENGCPCPLCDAILGYNIYLNKINMNCAKCKNLLVKTTVHFLKEDRKGNLFSCYSCHDTDKYDFLIIYRCNKCKINVCNRCAFEFNIKNLNKIKLPNYPLFLDEIKKNIKENTNEKFAVSKICPQTKFKITSKKKSGNVICLYLKTLVGRIYTINIDDGLGISNLKNELKKMNKKYSEDNSIFIYQNKVLEDDNCINECGLTNESLINVVLK